MWKLPLKQHYLNSEKKSTVFEKATHLDIKITLVSSRYERRNHSSNVKEMWFRHRESGSVDTAVKIWAVSLVVLITKIKYYATWNICPQNIAANLRVKCKHLKNGLMITHCTIQIYHASENKYVREPQRSWTQGRVTVGRWPIWCTIILCNTFTVTIFYRFRATLSSSSGGQIVLTVWPLTTHIWVVPHR